MRQIIRVTMTAAGLCLFSMCGVLSAQQYSDQDTWHHDRDAYYQRQGWRGRFFERIRMDLDHVQASRFSGADEDRIVQTKHTLDEMPACDRSWPTTGFRRATGTC